MDTFILTVDHLKALPILKILHKRHPKQTLLLVYILNNSGVTVNFFSYNFKQTNSRILHNMICVNSI